MGDNRTDELVGLARTPEQAEYIRKEIREAHPDIAIFITFNRLEPDYYEISVSSPWSTRLPDDRVDDISKLVEKANGFYEVSMTKPAMTGHPVGVSVGPAYDSLASWPVVELDDEYELAVDLDEDEESDTEKLQP